MASWLERLTVVRRCYISCGIGFGPRYKLIFFSDFQKKASEGWVHEKKEGKGFAP